MGTKQEKSAGAVIYYMDEESNQPYFLMLENTLKTTYWEMPKGKIEENEKIEETALRETREETQLNNLQVIRGFKESIRWFFKFQGDLISKEAIYILVKIPFNDRAKVRINEEHQKFKWMSIEEAREQVKIKANRDLLEKACQFIKEYEKQTSLF